MTVLILVMGTTVYRPPPRGLIPPLAIKLLWVTTLLISVRDGAAPHELPFQIPPPWTAPLGPLPVPTLLLTVMSCNVTLPLQLLMPPPATNRSPEVVVPDAELPTTLLSVIVTPREPGMKIAPDTKLPPPVVKDAAGLAALE